MAKKRIAADVDLCGNSVENVKNVTASGTVKANTLEGALKGEMLASLAGKSSGKVATLPNYTYKILFGEGKYVGATDGPTYPEFYKKWLQQLVADNLLTARTTYFCQAEPNGVVAIMLSVTDVTPLSSDGLPRICCATAIDYTGNRTLFGVNTGTFYCYVGAYSGNGTATRAALDGNGANIATTYATRRYAASLFDNLANTYATKEELDALNKYGQDISLLKTRTIRVETKTQSLTADGSEFTGKVYYDGYGDEIAETYLRKDDLTAGDGIEISTSHEISLALADANAGDQTEDYLRIDQGKLAIQGIDKKISDAVDDAKTDLSSSFATKLEYNSLNSQVQAQQTHISTLMNERVSVSSARTGTIAGPTSGTHIWGFVSNGGVNLPSSGVTGGTRLTVTTLVQAVTIKRSDGGTIFKSGSGGVTSITVQGYSFAECIYMNGSWIVKI